MTVDVRNWLTALLVSLAIGVTADPAAAAPGMSGGAGTGG